MKGIHWGLLSLALSCAAPVWANSANEYVAEAREYLQKGEPRAAIIQLKNALQEDPSNVTARLMLAELHLRSGDLASAAKEYERAKRLGAPAENWMLGLGQALALQGKHVEVLAEINPAADQPVELRAMAHAQRGNAYLAQGDQVQATAEYDLALAIEADNPLAHLGKARMLIAAGDQEAAMAQLNQVLMAHPDHVQSLLVRAELQRSQKQFAGAKADFDAAIAAAPNSFRAYLGRALVLIGQDDTQAAKADIKQLDRLVPKLPATNYLKGLVAFQERDLDKASEHLQLVLRDLPDNFQAQMLYGLVSYALQQFTVADDYLSRVVQLAPESVQMRKLLAATRIKLKQPKRAIEVLEPLVADGQQVDVQSLAILGTAYMLSGDNSRGAEYMGRAVELDPEQALLRTQLAAGQLASGELDAAIAQLENAVSLGQDVLQADVLLVMTYLNKREFAKAIEAAAALESRMSDSPVPPNLSGLAYLAEGNFEQAQSKFEQALTIDPKFVVAHMNLARLGNAAEKPALAKRQYEAVLKQEPKHLGAMMGLSTLAGKAGDREGAERWLNKAREANPTALQPILLLSEAALSRNEVLKADRILADLSEEQGRTAAALRLKGMSALQKGDPSIAKVHFERLVALQPNSIEGWFQLGRSQLATGDQRAAVASMDRAVELDVNHKVALVWVARGELALRERQYEQALSFAKRMQTYFPDHAMSFEIEARAQRALGQQDAALAAAEKALAIEATTQRVNGLAQALLSGGKGAKAAQTLEQWLEQHPSDRLSWATLGLMHQQLGNDDKALVAYAKHIELGGQSPVVLNNMAWLNYEKGDLATAERLAKQAYDSAPQRPEIVDTYGWIMLKSGDANKALTLLQQALLMAPENAEINLHVADALEQLGRKLEAKPLLERVVKEHPNTEWEAPARDRLARIEE